MPSSESLRIGGDSARKRINFLYNGRSLSACEGETIGAALHASGVKVLSRSVKYRRPRGLFCMAGNCPNCLMQVDGRPNIRACVYPVREGAQVCSQSGWPSTRFDAFASIDALGFLFPIGFPYRYFVRGGWLYHKWERLLRHMAGHGLPRNGALNGVSASQVKTSAECEIAVVGAGPAGLAAAQAASSAGCQVALIDEGARPGGSLLLDNTAGSRSESRNGQSGGDLLKRLTAAIEGQPNLRSYLRACAFGYYDDGLLGVLQENHLIKLRSKRLIVATGAYENPTLAENWDRPGVMLGTAVQRLLALGIKPGRKAVVTAVNDFGLEVARRLIDSGVEVIAVADCRSESEQSRRLAERGVKLLMSHGLKAVRGRASVKAALLAPCDQEGRIVSSNGTSVACDLAVTAGALQPANELLFQATYKGSYVLESAGTLARVPITGDDMRVDENLYAAGNAGSIGDLEKSLLEGEIAGLSAALSLKAGSSALKERCESAKARLSARRQS